MSDTYTQQLRDNYRELSESTGESFESIAVRVESHGDKHMAAWLRSQAADNAPAGVDPTRAAPKGRAAGNKSVKAAADADADAAAQAAAEAAGKAAADAEAAEAAKAAEAAEAKAKADAAADKK